MKKILFLIFVLLATFNVNADTCVYRIGDNDYSLDFNVDFNTTNWKNAYSFNGKNEAVLYGETTTSASSYYAFTPNKKEIFSKFNKFGSMVQEGACPVLVSIGNVENSNGVSVDGYTVIPYNVYTSYFALDVTLNCSSGCNDNTIRAADELYNFENVCNYFSTDKNSTAKNYYIYTCGRRDFPIDTPLLGFIYYNSHYETLVEVCKTYNSSGEGATKNLREYLDGYEDDFIIGIPGDEDFTVCPLVDDINDDKDILDCVEEKNKNISDAVESFRNSCSEKEMRAIESYAGGSTSKFYESKGVSPLLDNEIKMLFDSFTIECGEAADDLYKIVSNVGRILTAYGSQDNIKNTMIFMSLESYYIEGFSLLTTINANIKPDEDACSLISDNMRSIIKEILNALKIGTVILVIFLSIVEIYKAIIAGDDGIRKKMPSLIFKRIIILIVVLLLPTLILIVLDLLNKYMPVDTSKCVISDLE